MRRFPILMEDLVILLAFARDMIEKNPRCSCGMFLCITCRAKSVYNKIIDEAKITHMTEIEEEKK